MLAAGSALIGLVLGLRFKVFILIPLLMVGAAALILADALHLAAVSSTVSVIVFMASLQLGYALSAYLSYAAFPPRRLCPAGAMGLKLR